MTDHTEDNRIDGYACTDCALWIVNDDDTGATEDWDRETAQATREQFDIVIEMDEAVEMSNRPCFVCDSDVSGDRHTLSMWER